MASRSGSLAPSALARSPQFELWVEGTILQKLETPLAAAVDEFKKLTVFKLPKHFTTDPTVSHDGEADFYAKLKDWACNNERYVYRAQQDPDKLGEISKHLSLAYWMTCGAASTRASESAQRRGVDILIEMAFALRVGATHDVRFKQDLHVCRSNWQGRRVGSKAVVDTVVVKAVPGDKTDQIRGALNGLGLATAELSERRRRLFWTPDVTSPNTIILFLGEYKKTEGKRNENQLVLDFGTAQYQRRCLGLPNAVIWGITYANGSLDVYSSMWTDTEPLGIIPSEK